ncbi:MAG: hypothetical protein IPO58_02190 [Betaproteobacteria bacterium]|nr:hypothetical protein [Betaproteobacteria bacterium]
MPPINRALHDPLLPLKFTSPTAAMPKADGQFAARVALRLLDSQESDTGSPWVYSLLARLLERMAGDITVRSDIGRRYLRHDCHAKDEWLDWAMTPS